MNDTKALQKADEIISEKAALNAAEALEPLRYASSLLTAKMLELMPQVERISDIRTLAGAIKDLSQIIRELNGILTAKEQAELELSRQRIALERELMKQNENTDTEIRFIIETE